MVSHLCACAHEASTFPSSQTFARIQDNCTCMVSPLSAVVHGQLPCFLASLRLSLVIRTKKMLTNSANLEPTIATVTVYESADPLSVGQGRQACGDCCPLPVSLPYRSQNPRVCAAPQLRQPLGKDLVGFLKHSGSWNPFWNASWQLVKKNI